MNDKYSNEAMARDLLVKRKIPTGDAIAGPSENIPDEQDDFTYLCRICTIKTHNILPLFEKEGLEQKLVEKINTYLPIKVSKDDLLPAGVCEQCSNAVLAWHELVVCCVQADASFRKRISLSHTQTVTSQAPETSTSVDAPHIDEDGIKYKRMSEYLRYVAPAPPYANTRFTETATPAAIKKCNLCDVHKETTFRISQTEAQPNCLEYGETCRRSCLVKENIEPTKPLHTDWRCLPKPSEDTGSSFNMFENISNSSTENNASLNIINTTYNNALSEYSSRNIESSIEHTSNNIETEPDMAVNTSRSPDNLSGSNTRYVYNYVADKDTCLKNNEIVMSLNTHSDETNEVARVEQNEFSDHSDSESFTRLSESVFEAIEDTQDSVIENRDPVEEISTRAQEETKSKSKHKPRTCHICGKLYKASSSYFYHMKHFHRRPKDHSCDVCNKKFGTRGDLNQHSAVHSTECKFECRSCDKKFRSRASRYIHEQIHDGAKLFKCARCEKSFRWRTHLQRHMLRHAAEKQHECARCGRGFAVRCDLLRHARTHDAGCHRCGECGVQFAQLRYLKAHTAKKHSVTARDTG